MSRPYVVETKTVPGWDRPLENEPDLLGLRREVSDALAPELRRGELEDVLLVLTELVSNSYRHTDAPDHASVMLTDEGVLVEVTDGDPGDIRLRRPSPVQSEGRGLLLVGAVSTDWGVFSTNMGEGKTVWALLPANG
jgi:anti-sigma regulatory factor (Ser/Thr protein kinase)